MTSVESGVVEEVLDAGDVPLWRHSDWRERFPWLVQGVTGAGDAAEPFDLGLFGAEPVGRVLDRWERLRAATGMRRVVHARQVHGAELRAHGVGEEQGILIGTGYDGHLTRAAGLLLTVSIADCVPVFLVDDVARAVAVVHAGWRGVAAGIVERAIERLRVWRGDGAGELWLHCGPAICGRCYEVGPEVHAGVRPEEEPPTGPAPIDLRAEILRRAMARDVAAERSTVSAHCTKCGPGKFFSHRGGSPARQMAILGMRG